MALALCHIVCKKIAFEWGFFAMKLLQMRTLRAIVKDWEEFQVEWEKPIRTSE